jgi:hypothetical protein
MAKKLTYSRFQAMTPPEKARAYFDHENNRVPCRKVPGFSGISQVAQANFHNDWRAALHNFADQLPSR